MTPICTKKCEPGYSLPYDQDKHYAASNYSIPNDVAKIQTEIMTNGPVETTFNAFGDFICYKSGTHGSCGALMALSYGILVGTAQCLHNMAVSHLHKQYRRCCNRA